MKYFLDTEFIEDGKTIDLISIGIVSEAGKEFYEISSEFEESKASPWVVENVIAKLGDKPRISREEIKNKILAFIGNDPKPEFWGYFADYDWVVFCQLFGTMMDLPKKFPMFCLDIKQESKLNGVKMPAQKDGNHNALEDAKWTCDSYYYLCNH